MTTRSSSAWGQSETQYFFDLHPDRILSTVELLGVRCTGRVIPLNSLENRVFEVEIDDDSKSISPKVVAKFYRPGRWTEAQILEEHQFLFDLQEADIPVVAPKKFADGKTVQLVKGTNVLAAVFPKQRGRNPDELSFGQLAWLGRLLARVHNVGVLKDAPNRLVLDPVIYGLNNLQSLLDNEAIPENMEERYSEVVREICEISAPQFGAAHYQRIHGDCHFGNILWGDEGPFLVDFDDMVVGPCVQDLWLLSPGRNAEQLDTLIAGYEEMREFDRSTLQLIEPLRALRFVHFSAWIEKRWDDPAFQNAYPLFGTDKYWREQLSDLEELLEIIR